MVSAEELREFADGIAERIVGRWNTTVDDAWGFRLALVSEQDTGVKGTVWWTRKGAPEVVMEPYGVDDNSGKLAYVGKWSERITFGEFDDPAFVGFARRMTDMVGGLRRYRDHIAEIAKRNDLMQKLAAQIPGEYTHLTSDEDLEPTLLVRREDLGSYVTARPLEYSEDPRTELHLYGYVSREVMVAIGNVLAEWETEETP